MGCDDPGGTMRIATWVVLLGLLSSSCGGEAVELSGGEDVGEATAVGAKPSKMRIDSVRTIDGHTQIRMGDTVELVIRGEKLQAVRSVTIEAGGFTAGTVVVLSSRRTVVRARVAITHGALAIPYSVSVAGPHGSATLADAIEVTPYVVAPVVAAGGKGTFQSPLSLCDEEVEGATTGDQILLLEGEHRCDDIVDLGAGGQSVIGAGPGATIIRGASGSFGGFVTGFATSLEGFTISAAQPAAGAAIFRRGPGLRVSRVDLVGAGVRIEDDEVNLTFADVQELTYAGEGNGIETIGVVFLDVRNSRFTGCATGIAFDRGRLNFFESAVEGCDIGVQIASVPATPLTSVGAQMFGLTLTDNRIGLLLEDGVFDVVSVEISDDETTPATSERGVVIHNGKLTLSFTNIRGQEIAGIDAAVLGGDESRLEAEVGIVTIEGGQYGVRAHGPGRRGSLVMFDSIVNDQTVAAVSLAIEDRFILSLDGFSNHLSVLSGFALEDLRQAAGPENPLIARTTSGDPLTLNGRTYTELGLVTGPVSVPPDFRILHESGSIQF